MPKPPTGAVAVYDYGSVSHPTRSLPSLRPLSRLHPVPRSTFSFPCSAPPSSGSCPHPCDTSLCRSAAACVAANSSQLVTAAYQSTAASPLGNFTQVGVLFWALFSAPHCPSHFPMVATHHSAPLCALSSSPYVNRFPETHYCVPRSLPHHSSPLLSSW